MWFIHTHGNAQEIGIHIISIIREAGERIIILTPYIQIGEDYKKVLSCALRRGVRVDFVVREDYIKDNEDYYVLQDWSRRYTNFSLKLNKDLHAKCYANEQKAVITSMNLYEYSENNNIEMGCIVSLKEDTRPFQVLWKELDDILRTSDAHPIARERKGYCIRCGKSIPFSEEKPLCADCFHTWSIYKDPDYPEKHCHCCGKSEPVSMKRPLCRHCWHLQFDY